MKGDLNIYICPPVRYLKEGNKVILEEVFPEIREIIFDIIKKFEEPQDTPDQLQF